MEHVNNSLYDIFKTIEKVFTIEKLQYSEDVSVYLPRMWRMTYHKKKPHTINFNGVRIIMFWEGHRF